MDPSFKNWIDKGITSICGIVKEDEIMSFQTLKQMFHLENQDHYRHLQLRNFYTWSIKNQTPTTATPLIQLFVNAYKSETKKGVISQIYKSLHDLSNYSTKYIKERWEKEGGQAITDDRTSVLFIGKVQNHMYGRNSAGKVLLVFSLPQL